MLRVARGRNAFEVFLLAWSVVAGVSSLTNPGPPPSLAAALPGWVTVVWSGMLAAAGTVALIGVALRSPTWGLLLERVALAPLAGGAFAYAIAAWSAAGWRAFAAGLLIFAYGAACAARVIHITRDVRRVTRTAVEVS